MLLKVKYLGHEIVNNTIKPIPSQKEVNKGIPSAEEKKDVMQLIGSFCETIRNSLKNYMLT